MNQVKFMKKITLYTSILSSLFLFGCGASNTSNKVVKHPSMAKVINQGTTIGTSYFRNGDRANGGYGQTIDGIPGDNVEMSSYHIHVHLTLIVNGKQIAVPKGIGIVPPWIVDHGFIHSGKALYWLHTHDATGIIHVESPFRKTFTLKNFFDIWGEPLKNSDIAGFHGVIRVFVDGTPYPNDPGNIILKPHEEITLEIGSPFVPIPVYTFPAGL